MSEQPYLATVNGQLDFSLTPDDARTLDLTRDAAGHYHLLWEGRSYRAEVLQVDPVAKSFTLRINGNPYTVELADRYDQLISRLGLELEVHVKISEIKAPMPGLVLDIQVEEGQEILLGDPVLILEAMKMENVLQSPGEGRVGEVLVKKGQAVDKGQVLVRMA
ncbi:MAG: acetyl-CoA carboxylase biotin carboxyl carrier protein subunit [Saprospiraceae bacterium]|nr:acetyl-CoA carboxylase biotin carboxyl carrier protein subunit [Saprospiraceae bacterium]MCB0624023.1 acetyl-CoA carboxylase biotin carboxyl carrier protein subunit [Saprospiraceae bacterium]MCB0678192.1 acetyl-CoA carboxylase biotin carboxyl carrier protein subunit [Saprospiraceae bacterium]MCB0682672.1 acetyl-CoA carboxylase biotin carboxyl carrier protein subunit [Saprospiraceae bacterium]